MLANLARLGNKDVTRRFACDKLVDAARRVTSLTTRRARAPPTLFLTLTLTLTKVGFSDDGNVTLVELCRHDYKNDN